MQAADAICPTAAEHNRHGIVTVRKLSHCRMLDSLSGCPSLPRRREREFLRRQRRAKQEKAARRASVVGLSSWI